MSVRSNTKVNFLFLFAILFLQTLTILSSFILLIYRLHSIFLLAFQSRMRYTFHICLIFLFIPLPHFFSFSFLFPLKNFISDTSVCYFGFIRSLLISTDYVATCLFSDLYFLPLFPALNICYT